MRKLVFALLPGNVFGQSEIVKLDFENGSFKNFPQLPFGESFLNKERLPFNNS